MLPGLFTYPKLTLQASVGRPLPRPFIYNSHICTPQGNRMRPQLLYHCGHTDTHP